MQLRDALDDYKRNTGHDTRFPGERRTVTGRFSGGEGRLVHVDADGELRDFGYPLTGQTGLVRSRVGLAVGDEVTWLDEVETQQRYVGDTTLIETVHETDRATVTRHDVTLGDAHLTRVTIDVGDDGHANVDPADLSLVVYARFAPDGRDNRVGQLRYDDAIEVYHADEHDFLASDTGFTDLRGQLPTTFPELLDDAPTDLPATATATATRKSVSPVRSSSTPLRGRRRDRRHPADRPRGDDARGRPRPSREAVRHP